MVDFAACVVVFIRWLEVDGVALNIEDVDAEELVVEMGGYLTAWGVYEAIGRKVDALWAWRFNWARKLDFG